MRSYPSGWNSVLTQLGFRRRPRKCREKSVTPRRLGLEHLESRQLLAITVTTLIDEDNGTGALSLREAINSATPGITIDFDPALFASGPGTIELSGDFGTQLVIDTHLAIIGPGSDLLTINARGRNRALMIDDGTSVQVYVEISGVTITGGNTSGDGGGIFSNENLALDSVVISGNKAAVRGGGIYQSLGGDLTIWDSSVEGNTAVHGGGLFVHQAGTADELLVMGSTFADNEATTGSGGAVHLQVVGPPFDAIGTARFVNSTFTRNSAGSTGGGLYLRAEHAQAYANVLILNSTITDNVGDWAGGVINVDDGVVSTLHNTIVAGNRTRAGALADVAGNVGVAPGSTHNLFSQASVSGISATAGNQFEVSIADIFVLDPEGRPLLSNTGGSTRSIDLKPLGAAIDKGSDTALSSWVVTSDQRGIRRKIDNPFVATSNAVDIGAVEKGVAVTTIVDQNDGYQNGGVSLRDALALATAAGDAPEPFRIEFAEHLIGGTIPLNHGEMVVGKSVQIAGPGAHLLAIDAHQASRIFNVTDNSGTYRNVEIVGLTLKNGNAISVPDPNGSGGGIHSSENLVVRNVTFVGNKGRAGGAFRNTDGSVSIIDSTFENNESQWGGGATLTSTSESNSVRISDSTFVNNRAKPASGYSSAGYGGGIYVLDGGTSSRPIDVHRSTFSLNTADVDGGGAYLDWNSDAVRFSGVVFDQNTAKYSGGAFRSVADSFVMLSGLVRNNTATWGGGGVLNGRSRTDIVGATIQTNHATNAHSLSGGGSGGGLYLLGGSASTPIKVLNSTIAGNDATYIGGGVVLEAATAHLTHNTITANTNSSAAGVYNLNGALTLNNTIVADNVGTDYSGNQPTAGSGNLFDVGTGSWASSFGYVLPSGTAKLSPTPGVGGAMLYIPQPDSAAIDRGGSGAWNLNFDQRGNGNRRSLNGTVDVGAIEANVIRDGQSNVVVYATDRDDRIHASRSTFNGNWIAIDGMFTLDLGTVASLSVFALAGDDHIDSLDPSLSEFSDLPLSMDGGSGRDALLGGDANDTLSGGTGVDILEPRFGTADVPEDIGMLTTPAVIDEGQSISLSLDWSNVTATSATIDWGDGAAPTLATPSGGPYSHTYLSDSSTQLGGRFSIRVEYVHLGDLVKTSPRSILVRSLDLAPPRITQVTGSSEWNFVTWDHMISPNSSITSFTYEIQRSRSGLDGTWEADGTVPLANGNAAPYALGQNGKTYQAGFTGAKYYYRMRSVSGAQTSAWTLPATDPTGSDTSLVRVTARAISSAFAPAVELTWPDEYGLQANADSVRFDIQRKLPTETTWTHLGSFDASEAGTSFVDRSVHGGTVYEYLVTRSVDGLISGVSSGKGYVVVSVDGAPADQTQRGAVELIIDNRFSASLAFEIARLIQDLEGDGWKVNDHYIDVASSTPQDVKALIEADRAAAVLTSNTADDVKSIFLFGHIPIPQSGFSSPDGHGNRPHPADVYYGDIDGVWEDLDVQNYPLPDEPVGLPQISKPSGNMNVRADGIFDQNTVPLDGDASPVELSVGRVDMHLMANFDPISHYDLENGEWQTYTIPVGRSYTGVFDFMSFVSGESVNDARIPSIGTTEIKEIYLSNFKRNGVLIVTPELITLTPSDFEKAAETPGPWRFGYDGRESPSSVASSGGVLQLSGNAWQVASIKNPATGLYEPIEIVADTVLELKMRHDSESELNEGKDRPYLIAVGFDKDEGPKTGLLEDGTTVVSIDRAVGHGGGYQHISEELTFRLFAEPNFSWGRAIDPTLETELLRRYLNKDHAFRNDHWEVRDRALLDARLLGHTGWQNLTAMFGEDIDAQISELDHSGVSFNWRDHADVPNNSYLWGFGGRHGTYWQSGEAANMVGDVDYNWPGIMDSEFLSHTPSYVVFNEHFGSWSVDWDRSDSLLKSHLANSGYGLTSTWGDWGNFTYYHMGVGGTVGDSLLVTQTRGWELIPTTTAVYKSLLGDPTLRLHIVNPPTNVVETPSGGGVNVSWAASTEQSIVGYHIYRALSGGSDYGLIATTPAGQLSYLDSSGSTAGYDYMVRAVKREDGSSGSYYNLSQGAFSAGIQLIAAINSGGPAVTSGGNSFASGTGYPSLIDVAPTPLPTIDMTRFVGLPLNSSPQLFQNAWTISSGSGFTWSYASAAIQAGHKYAVRLYLAEIQSAVTKAKDRVFDVLAEGASVLQDVDIYAAVGSNAALVKTFVVTASDGDLDLTFEKDSTSTYAPLIAGIEIFRL